MSRFYVYYYFQALHLLHQPLILFVQRIPHLLVVSGWRWIHMAIVRREKSVAPQRGERLAPRYCRRLLPGTLSQIRDREVNLHIILHLFRMHHFVV